MKIRHAHWLVAALPLVLLALSACGSSSSATATVAVVHAASPTTAHAASPTVAHAASPTATHVAAATATHAASPTTAHAASPTTGSGTTVQLRTDPKLGQIFTDTRGMTLYTYAKDTATSSACTGTCATAWPPLAATGTPTLPAGVAGTLSTITRSDGTTQVAYNGHPLYRYAMDTAPGDVKGQGVGGVWTVATPGH